MTETNGRWKFDPQTALQVIAFIVAVALAYGMVQSDVAVMKEQIRQLREDVTSLRTDVKQLLNRP